MTEKNSNPRDRIAYTGIDLLKFFLALCVVMIHVKSFFPAFNPGLVVNFIISMAVPFFFIASGFLLSNKLSKTHDISTILNYSKRIWKMYFYWILIYVPLCVLGEIIQPSEPSWTRFAMVQVRSVFLLGDIRFSYPTWYLFSLGIGSSLIYYFKKKRLSLLILMVMGTIGIFLQYLSLNIEASHTIKTAISSLSRITIGTGYVICGMYIFHHTRIVKLYFIVILMVIGLVLATLRLPYCETFGSISLFMIALMKKGHTKESIGLWCRKQSLWIYLTHMYVLTPLCLFAVVSNAWATFGVSAIICIGISQILIIASANKRGEFLNRLI